MFFLELPCFFNDPVNAGNLISGSSAFSKSSLNIWKFTEELYKNDLHDPDNYNDVIINLEPDTLECEVKWALGSITTNKASGGNGIQVELFQILNGDAVKVVHSVCQQIWKTQQWPQGLLK